MNALQFLLICLAGWINRQQQCVIEYLQEEVKELREQLGKKPRFTDDQRCRLLAKAQKIGWRGLRRVASIVSPKTLLEWHGCLIQRKYDGSHRRSPGRPGTAAELRGLILQLAEENRTWGYTPIQGALANVGHEVGRSNIAQVLKEAGLESAPERRNYREAA